MQSPGRPAPLFGRAFHFCAVRWEVGRAHEGSRVTPPGTTIAAPPPVKRTPPQIALEFIGDQFRRPFTLREDRPVSIGRAADSDIVLLGETVSRRHASVSLRPSGTLITDLGSTHGTQVNSLRIEPNKATPLAPGDLVQVGPFALRVALVSEASGRGLSTVSLKDDSTTSFQVQTLASVSPHAGRRLRALTECIARLDAAASVKDAAEIALTYALDGSGYAHAAVLRRSTEMEVEVIASRRLGPVAAHGAEFSRSLLTAAESGRTAVLAPQSRVTSNSLAGLNIHSALCAPIRVGESTSAFLYLDARDQESEVDPEAAGFCEALATAMGLSFANLVRADLERRQLALSAELSAAHEAQQFILPEADARRDFLVYGMRMRPGAYVAGDLFDVVPLADGRVAIAIGDVAGHGAGSAMLMASTQAHLNAQLETMGDPAAALSAVNAYLSKRALGGRFVSLWLGIFSADGTVEFVDAGHGHWMHIPSSGEPANRFTVGGSIPIGVSSAATFRSSTFTLAPGDRVLLFTDGLTEQRDPAGLRFGMERLLPLLKLGQSPAHQVQEVLDTVVRHSGLGTLEDDATVACIEYSPLKPGEPPA